MKNFTKTCVLSLLILVISLAIKYETQAQSTSCEIFCGKTHKCSLYEDTFKWCNTETKDKLSCKSKGLKTDYAKGTKLKDEGKNDCCETKDGKAGDFCWNNSEPCVCKAPKAKKVK